MAERTMRLLTWNLERKKPTSRGGSAALELLVGQNPDVMVLTEAKTTLPWERGHLVWSQPLPHDPRLEDDDRRVVMWSKQPWSDVDDVGVPALPGGRFVRASTKTPAGRITVVGVCIPWHMANVRYGSRDRAPWEDHLEYLRILPSVLSEIDGPVIVAGDFNQRIPRTTARKDVSRSLEVCFRDLSIVTAGDVLGYDGRLIDHIAVDSHLAAERVWAWPSRVDGVRMSDHAGAGADVVQAASRQHQPDAPAPNE